MGTPDEEVSEVSALIAALRLEPLAGEGGWFRRVAEGVPMPGEESRRTWSTILALFTAGQFSALHRLSVDEVWTHVAGDPLEMVLLTPPERGQSRILGRDGAPVVAVPAGTWQGARPCSRPDRGWSLVSCTCVPGFTRTDFELGERDRLAGAFPKWRESIRELTR